ncbi:hypothetical protein GCM10009836_68720 [Pseudonocardia ailaonensis]|uniref:ESX-1 secretion-associated protein n=1 Tax=Pseudonocardia ailaonensis TaxID=367279 RepID=A0ABN2NPE7_9PSEU
MANGSGRSPSELGGGAQAVGMQPDLSLDPDGAGAAAAQAARLAADLGDLHTRIRRLGFPDDLAETVSRAADELDAATDLLRTTATGLREADADAARAFRW